MGLFSLFSKSTKDARQSLANLGNADEMQAIVYGCLFASCADGEIEKAEIDRVERMLQNNPKLKGFGTELTKLMEQARQDFEAGGTRIIRMNAMKELEDISHDHEIADRVFNYMLATCEADGDFDDKEKAAMERAARTLGLNLENYL